MKVVALDAAEHFSQSFGLDHIMHELRDESSTERGHLHGGLVGLGEGGVEETQAETILQVSDSIYKTFEKFSLCIYDLFIIQRGFQNNWLFHKLGGIVKKKNYSPINVGYLSLTI